MYQDEGVHPLGINSLKAEEKKALSILQPLAFSLNTLGEIYLILETPLSHEITATQKL
jgi:hypothetical protein